MEEIQFTLEHIKELKYSIRNSKEYLVKEILFRTATVIDMDCNLIAITPSIRYLNERKSLLEYECEISYRFTDLSDIVEYSSKEGNIIFNTDIMPILLRSTIDTVRGILFMKTENMEYLPLPIISPDQLLQHNTYTVPTG